MLFFREKLLVGSVRECWIEEREHIERVVHRRDSLMKVIVVIYKRTGPVFHIISNLLKHYEIVGGHLIQRNKSTVKLDRKYV